MSRRRATGRSHRSTSLQRRVVQAGTVAVLASLAPELVTPVAGHGGSAMGTLGVALDPAVAVVAVTSVGLVAGLLAAGGRTPTTGGRLGAIDRAVGPLLVGLGGLALLVGLSHGVARAAGGLLLGGVAGVAVTKWGTCGYRTGVAVGAIGVHRSIEGVALGTLVVADAAIGAVAVVIVTGHAIVECLAVGGSATLEWSRAVGAVLGIQIAFLAGAGLSLFGLAGPSVTPTALVTAGVGIVLLVVGLAETAERGHG